MLRIEIKSIQIKAFKCSKNTSFFALSWCKLVFIVLLKKKDWNFAVVWLSKLPDIYYFYILSGHVWGCSASVWNFGRKQEYHRGSCNDMPCWKFSYFIKPSQEKHSFPLFGVERGQSNKILQSLQWPAWELQGYDTVSIYIYIPHIICMLNAQKVTIDMPPKQTGYANVKWWVLLWQNERWKL